MRKWLLFLFAISGIGFMGPELVQAADLDNSAWRISEKGKKDTEDLIFVDGNFTSSGCIPYGFGTTAYTSFKEGDAIRWTTTQMNKNNEKMVWNGSAKGKEISGAYVFTDKNGKTWTSEWMGKKLEAK